MKLAVVWAAGVGVMAADDAPIPGLTRPFRDATLSAASPGIVDRVLAREGVAVKRGDALIELDRRQEELEVARRQLLWENQAELRAAAARRATALAELESSKAVYEATRSVSREELERKQLEFALAEADELKAKMAKERERIELEMAREALERRTVRAPMDGVVTAVLIEEGEGCELRQPLITVVDVSLVEFVANVEAPLLAGFRAEQAVRLDIETPSGALCVTGSVSYVAPVIDGASGLGELRSVFTNSEGRVRPGVPAALRPPGPAAQRP